MCSLKYFLNETDFTKNNLEPLFEAQLHLDESESEIYFLPPMIVTTSSLGSPVGFLEIINGLLKSVYNQGSLIQRVAIHLNKENYKVRKHLSP